MTIFQDFSGYGKRDRNYAAPLSVIDDDSDATGHETYGIRECKRRHPHLLYTQRHSGTSLSINMDPWLIFRGLHYSMVLSS